MYVPRHFATEDLAQLDSLFERDAFVTLVSIRDGAPYATHLPVLYRRDGDRVTVHGHWARGNPQWRGIEDQQVMLVALGPHAYVSPTWYVEPAHGVPTWNYASAHLYGRLRLIDDTPGKEAVVSALAHKYESRNRTAWRLADAHPDVQRELGALVAFELAVERIELKLKLNQHHTRANLAGAIAGLSSSDAPGAGEVAEMMRTVSLPSARA